MANLKITMTRSLVGRPENQRKIIKGLGLRKIRHTVIREDTPAIRGMVFKVKHLVTMEETTEELTPSRRSVKRAQA